MDRHEILFVVLAFLFQIILITHFALRKWSFDTAMRLGWIVYVLSIPAAFISWYLWLHGKPWALFAGGFIYLIWAAYGFLVEYRLKVQWRNPPFWPVLIPYVVLYLATVMFYWWPLATLWKPLWYAYAVLFMISTWLNVTSHKPARQTSY